MLLQHTCVTLFGPTWNALEHELAHSMHTTMQGYWKNWEATQSEGFKVPSPEVTPMIPLF